MDNSNLTKYVDVATAPVPTPPGMTSRDIVWQALHFERPPRLPYSFFAPFESDFFETTLLKYQLPPERRAELGLTVIRPTEVGAEYVDQWGVGHQVTGRIWDNAFRHPLKDLTHLSSYVFPDVAAPRGFEWMVPYIEQAHRAGKFVVGGDPVMLFERLRALMGFDDLMLAPHIQPEGLRELLDRMSALTIAIIELYASFGMVDGFMSWEDFGVQEQLQMRIDTFREFYKPVYARIVEAAHRNKMAYIWHNCGYILEMIPDMIDIGVDVVQLDQPRLTGYEAMAEACGGRMTVWDALDIQWCKDQDVTPADYAPEIVRMIRPYRRYGGGFMARQYPIPTDINLSKDEDRIIYDAFMRNGCSLPQDTPWNLGQHA